MPTLSSPVTSVVVVMATSGATSHDKWGSHFTVYVWEEEHKKRRLSVRSIVDYTSGPCCTCDVTKYVYMALNTYRETSISLDCEWFNIEQMPALMYIYIYIYIWCVLTHHSTITWRYILAVPPFSVKYGPRVWYCNICVHTWHQCEHHAVGH